MVVTNRVDGMSRLFIETSGAARVYGVGSATDTARYRLALARLLTVPVDSAEGRVIGEQGDAAVVCASSTLVGGFPVAVPLRAVHDDLTDRPRRINAGFGRARSGPAGAVLATLRAALGLAGGVVELSVVNPHCGFLGTPLRYTAGTPTVIALDLDPVGRRLLDPPTTRSAPPAD